tara:strand:+ start:999 stop:1838 length:840 start_codon:yes stop_codon:yes gene_type:complete
MYYPKSQLTTNLSTNGKEYQLVDTGESYVGSYFKTSDGKYYTGKTPQDGNNQQLVRLFEDTPNSPSLPSDSDPTFPQTEVPIGYSLSTSSSPISITTPKGNIVFPTEGEYETGEYQRYFLKHNVNNNYLEVNQLTYNNFFNQNPIVPFQLYTAIKIDWILVGKPIEVYDINRNIALLYEKEKNIRGFSNFFKGRYLKYYRPLKNEYYTTKGGELKVQDTNENYAGNYHVYSTRGVIMEGKFHSASPHRVLIPFEGEEIAKDIIPPTISREVGTSIRKNY